MFKKIKTVMMMLVIGMTMLIAGCDNAAGGSGSGSGDSRQPVLLSRNGSTFTFTHDDPVKISSGSFTFELVDADKDSDPAFTFSEGNGTYTYDETKINSKKYSFSVESPSGIEISPGSSNGKSVAENGVETITFIEIVFKQEGKRNKIIYFSNFQ